MIHSATVYLEDRSIQLYDQLRDSLHLKHNRDFLHRMLVHKDLEIIRHNDKQIFSKRSKFLRKNEFFMKKKEK